jgi:hypothetical protein
MKPKKSAKIPANQRNVSINRAVLDSVGGDFHSALIVEYIRYWR